MSSGARSTEFWLTAASFLCGAVLAAAGVQYARDAAVYAGAAWAAVASVGYAHSRGRTKAPRPYLPPGGRI